jgi:hypothetical protein
MNFQLDGVPLRIELVGMSGIRFRFVAGKATESEYHFSNAEILRTTDMRTVSLQKRTLFTQNQLCYFWFNQFHQDNLLFAVDKSERQQSRRNSGNRAQLG